MDLIDRMLVFDPAKRITVDQALSHPYLASLHDAADEPVCTAPFAFDLDSDALTPDVVREIIIRDVIQMHPEYADEVGPAAVAAAVRQQAMPNTSGQEQVQPPTQEQAQPPQQMQQTQPAPAHLSPANTTTTASGNNVAAVAVEGINSSGALDRGPQSEAHPTMQPESAALTPGVSC